MLHLFNLGQRKDFFRRWVENISVNEINENIVGQKLEFELNIHFAIYYFRKNKDVLINLKNSIKFRLFNLFKKKRPKLKLKLKLKMR